MGPSEHARAISPDFDLDAIAERIMTTNRGLDASTNEHQADGRSQPRLGRLNVVGGSDSWASSDIKQPKTAYPVGHMVEPKPTLRVDAGPIST